MHGISNYELALIPEMGLSYWIANQWSNDFRHKHMRFQLLSFTSMLLKAKVCKELPILRLSLTVVVNDGTR